VNYFGFDSWSSGGSVDFPGAAYSQYVLVTSKNSGDFISAANIQLTSIFHSTEINVHQNICCGIDGLFGFRWVDMTDRYLADATPTSGVPTLTDAFVTRNDLFGLQAGLDCCVKPAGSLWIRGYVKGGVMINSASAQTAEIAPSGATYQAGDTQCRPAFFGEAGLMVCFQVVNHVSVSAGYQVMYVNNVAQPVNQIAQFDESNNSLTIDMGSGLLYHGANLGVEVVW
jgi:hypothetical protein